MLLLLSPGSAKSLPIYDKEVNGDRAILFIEDEHLRLIYKGEGSYSSYTVKEMLSGNEFSFWGHTILHYIRTSTVL